MGAFVLVKHKLLGITYLGMKISKFDY